MGRGLTQPARPQEGRLGIPHQVAQLPLRRAGAAPLAGIAASLIAGYLRQGAEPDGRDMRLGVHQHLAPGLPSASGQGTPKERLKLCGDHCRSGIDLQLFSLLAGSITSTLLARRPPEHRAAHTRHNLFCLSVMRSNAAGRVIARRPVLAGETHVNRHIACCTRSL